MKKTSDILEKILLGTALTTKASLDTITENTPAHILQIPENQIILQAIQDVHRSGSQVNFLKIHSHLELTEQLQRVGGTEYLTSLMAHSDPLMIGRIVDDIRALYLTRQVREVTRKYQEKMEIKGADVMSLQQQMRNDLESLEMSLEPIAIYTEYDLARQAAEKSLYNAEHQVSLLGMDTGYRKLNAYTEGWQGGRLYVIAARPSMGKTAFTIQLKSMLGDQGHKGVYFSLETSAINMTYREVSNDMKTTVSKVRKGILHSQQWDEFNRFVQHKKQTGGWVVDKGGISVEEIREYSRRLIMKGAEWVCIDYFQLVTTEKNIRDRRLELDHISRELTKVAKDFDIPVFLVCQLGRNTETRGGDKRPVMSDIRESGQLEQDLWMLIALWRPGYYGIQTDSIGNPYPDGYMEALVLKNKEGPTGTIHWIFNGETMSFEEYDPEKSNSDNIEVVEDDSTEVPF